MSNPPGREEAAEQPTPQRLPDEELRRISSALPAPGEVDDLADVFDMLGDPGRVRILSALLLAQLPVRDLAQVVGMSESAVSHALRLLRAHRMVGVDRVGREAFYHLADFHVTELLQLALAHAGHTTLVHPDSGDPHARDPRTRGHDEPR